MNYVKVSCLNEACSSSVHVTTIPAGRPVAPGITEKLGTLVCDECGHDMYVEPVK